MEYEFNKKINSSQLISELKQAGFVFDGKDEYLITSDDLIKVFFKTKLTTTKENLLNTIISNHTPIKPETLQEKRIRLKSALSSVSSIADLKLIIEELI